MITRINHLLTSKVRHTVPRKALSIFLIFCLVFSVISVPSYGDENPVDMEALFPTEEIRLLVYQAMGLDTNSVIYETDLERATSLSLYGITPAPSDLLGIKRLTGLSSFTINNTDITAIPDDLFTGMPNLSYVSIVRNANLDALPETLFQGHNIIEEVYLDSNNLTSLPLNIFSDVDPGFYLDISQNHIDLSSAIIGLPQDFKGSFLYSPQKVITVSQADSSVNLMNGNTVTREIRAQDILQHADYSIEDRNFYNVSALESVEITDQLVFAVENQEIATLAVGDAMVTFSGVSEGSTYVDITYEGKVLRQIPINVAPYIEGVIDFPDANLKTALIEYGVDINSDALITEEEMAAFTGILDLSNRNISDLTGLEHATGIRSLNLNNNKIKNLSPLSGLIELRSLGLSYNNISSLSPLAALTNLTSLNFSANPITDVTPLSELKEMQQLYYCNGYDYATGTPSSSLSDISALVGLINLQTLWITGTELSDITPIAGLINLDNVDLQENKISDISPLHNLTKLNLISLDRNPISNIDALAGLNELQTLWLRYTKNVSDISALNGLPKLYTVYLDDNHVSDVSPLASSSTLRGLSLRNNLVTDISPLSTCTNLATLDFGSNPVSDLTSLPSFPQLLYLSAFDIDAVDFTPLGTMDTLNGLNLSSNQIEDIGFITQMTSVYELNLGYNLITDISPLKDLTNLKTLYLSSNMLSALPSDSFSRLSKLSTLNLSDNSLDLNTITLELPQSLAAGSFYYNSQYIATFAEANTPITIKRDQTTSISIAATGVKIEASGFDATSGNFTGVHITQLGDITEKCRVYLLRSNDIASVVKVGDQAEITGLAEGSGKMVIEWKGGPNGPYWPLIARLTPITVDDNAIELPYFSFSSNSASVEEGQPYTLYVERNLPFGSTSCTVDVIGGTAAADDYSSTATFPAVFLFSQGETRKAITITPLADGKTEGSETLQLGIVKAGMESIDPVPSFQLNIVDTSIAYNDAEVVSINCPAIMTEYQENQVTVTLRNNGTIPWVYRDPGLFLNTPDMPGFIYDLKIGVDSTSPGDGPDDMEPVLSLVKARSKNVVQPGEEVTYTLGITPKATGSFSLKCRLLGLDVNVDNSPYLQYFGDYATLSFTVHEPVDSAEIISFDCPSVMLTDQNYFVTVVVKNTGETTWVPRSAETGSEWDWPGNTLVWYLGNDSAHPSRPSSLPDALFDWSVTTSDNSVAPGETVTYTYRFTPKAAAVGQQLMSFQMLGLNTSGIYNYFGPTSTKEITVKKPWNDAQVVSFNCPATMKAYQENQVTVTLRNNGTIPWVYRDPGSSLNTPDMPGFIYDLKIGVDGTSPGDGPDDMEPVLSFVKDRSRNVVYPGEEVTYTLGITPKATGSFNLKCRMLGQDVNVDNSPYLQYFGDHATLSFTVHEPVDSAEIISFDCPSVMLTDQNYFVTVVVKNTGETTWVPRSAETGSEWDWPGNTLVWYLGSDSAHPSRPDSLPGSLFDWSMTTSDNSVAPGETVTYTYRFTPNAAAVGQQLMSFQMLGLNTSGIYNYFGPTSSKVVAVRTANSVGIPNIYLVENTLITLTKDSIQAPAGIDLADLLTNGKLLIPIWSNDGQTQIGVLEIEPGILSGNAANISSAILKLNLQRQLNGQNATIELTTRLNSIPDSGSLEIVLDAVESADQTKLNALLGQTGDSIEGLPLIIVNVIKHNVDQGDIGPSMMTIKMTKPSDYTAQKRYLMIKEDDSGMLRLPSTTAAEGANIVFSGDSPGGFSRFIVVCLANQNSQENAEIVSSTLPSQMKAGQLGFYTVTVENTGTVAWTARKGYYLSGLGDVSSFGRVKMPILLNTKVKPGQKYTYVILLQAPQKAGLYTLSYQMSSPTAVFGQKLTQNISVVNNVYDCEFIKVDIPKNIKPGSAFFSKVNVKNTGNADWFMDTNQIRLIGTADSEKFGLSKVSLPRFIRIAPGEQYTFNVYLRAPQKLGNYTIKLQMSNGDSLFGPLYKTYITVKK